MHREDTERVKNQRKCLKLKMWTCFHSPHPAGDTRPWGQSLRDAPSSSDTWEHRGPEPHGMVQTESGAGGRLLPKGQGWEVGRG